MNVGRILCGIICAILTVAGSAGISLGDEDAAELVRRLGDPSFEKREDAMARLLNLGFKAREEVRKAMDSRDPEVKERSRELWKTLRWIVFPGADKEICETLAALGNDNERNAAAFEKMHGKYGADMIYLVREMREDKSFAPHAGKALAVLLKKSDAAALAEKTSRCDDLSDKEKLVEFLVSLEPKDIDSELHSKMLEVLKLLWLYGDACDFAKSAWLARHADGLVAEAAECMRLGGFENGFVKGSVDEINGENDRESKENIASFYIALSVAMQKKEHVEAIAECLGGFVNDKSALVRISKILLKKKLYEEADRLCKSRQDPLFLYVRSVCLAHTGKKEDSEELWKKVKAGRHKQEELYELGDFMGDRGDRRAEEIWEALLEAGKGESDGGIYAMNALLRLAPYCEKRGEYAKAADMYEKSLGSSKSSGACMIMTDSSGRSMGGEEAEKYLRGKIEALRKKAASGGR